MSEDSYPLHKAVFTDDIRALKSALRLTKNDVEQRDVHTLTPLLLAAKLGRCGCAELLLDHGARVDVKSDDGWSVLDESISYGNRDFIKLIVSAMHHQMEEELESLKPKLKVALDKVPDFSLEFNWEFASWIPFLSRVLPSDICRLHKQGTRLRVDSTLQGFRDLHWVRSKLTFYIDCTDLTVISVADHERRLLQELRPAMTNTFVEESTSAHLASVVSYSHISTQPIELRRCRTGWVWRSDREEVIAGHMCPVFDVTGITLIQRRRMEHLTEEDIKRVSSLKGKLNSSTGEGEFVDDEDAAECEDDDLDGPRVQFRPSLPPPPLITTWDRYVSSSSTGSPDGIGRQPRLTEERKDFKPVVALCEDFPIQRELILDILEIIAPYKHFNKLRNLVSRLPAGFPLHLELPLYPTISGKVTTQNFLLEQKSADFFKIPNYPKGRVLGYDAS